MAEVRVRVWIKGVVVAAVLAVGLFGYHKVMARVGSGTAPAMVAPAEQADCILVDKSERRLELWQGDTRLASYRIALGGAGDAGHKQREGDQRTPEGRYTIDWRNPRSMAHISLHVSYPNATDEEAARAAGHAPGGNTNAEMREIWSKVPNGTPIEIRP